MPCLSNAVSHAAYVLHDVKDQMLVCKHSLMGFDNHQQFLYTLDRPVHDISAAHPLIFRQADIALWLCR